MKRNEEAEHAKHTLNKLQMTYLKQVVEYESQAQAVVGITLNKLQMTYQKQLVEYESQAQAVVGIIIRLRHEKQEAHKRAQLGMDRIQHLMSARRDRTRTKHQ